MRSQGIFVLNLATLEIFRGTNDIAVGIKSRFNRAHVFRLINATQFELQYFRFWPFFLSPVILVLRFLQRMQLLLITNPSVESDIALPSKMINKILHLCPKKLSNKFNWIESSINVGLLLYLSSK